MTDQSITATEARVCVAARTAGAESSARSRSAPGKRAWNRPANRRTTPVTAALVARGRIHSRRRSGDRCGGTRAGRCRGSPHRLRGHNRFVARTRPDDCTRADDGSFPGPDDGCARRRPGVAIRRTVRRADGGIARARPRDFPRSPRSGTTPPWATPTGRTDAMVSDRCGPSRTTSGSALFPCWTEVCRGRSPVKERRSPRSAGSTPSSTNRCPRWRCGCRTVAHD